MLVIFVFRAVVWLWFSWKSRAGKKIDPAVMLIVVVVVERIETGYFLELLLPTRLLIGIFGTPSR